MMHYRADRHETATRTAGTGVAKRAGRIPFTHALPAIAASFSPDPYSCATYTAEQQCSLRAVSVAVARFEPPEKGTT
jgi:hypothetical protein